MYNDCCPSKEGTSVLFSPSAIARRKRREILRFKKLSYTTGLPRNDCNGVSISLQLKRARHPATDELDAPGDQEDMVTTPTEPQREEGRDCVQTNGKEVSLSSRILQNHTTDLPSMGTISVQMDMVGASEQVASRNLEFQYPYSALKKDGSTSQAGSAGVSLYCYKTVDSSAMLKFTPSSGQCKACTSCSSSCTQRCPPSGMLLLCGQRREMVDRAAIVPSFANLHHDLGRNCPCDEKEEGKSTRGLHFFAVYDGQGGSQASQFCMERLHFVLAKELATWCVVQDAKQDFLPCDWESVIASCFLKMDKEMGSLHQNGDNHDLGLSATHSGVSLALEWVRTTAVIAVVSSWQIVVATCGDSRAVLSRGGKAIPISLARRQEREDETNLLEAAGGQAIFLDGDGVGGFCPLPRAMDYHHLKHFMVSEPEVMCIQRSRDDEFLILASDGLWDVIDYHATCEITQKCLASTRKAQDFASHDFGEDPASIAAAAILVKVAFGRGSKDNISVIVIDLKLALNEAFYT